MLMGLKGGSVSMGVRAVFAIAPSACDKKLCNRLNDKILVRRKLMIDPLVKSFDIFISEYSSAICEGVYVAGDEIQGRIKDWCWLVLQLIR